MKLKLTFILLFFSILTGAQSITPLPYKEKIQVNVLPASSDTLFYCLDTIPGQSNTALLRVWGFEEVFSLQYSIRWDAPGLKFLVNYDYISSSNGSLVTTYGMQGDTAYNLSFFNTNGGIFSGFSIPDGGQLVKIVAESAISGLELNDFIQAHACYGFFPETSCYGWKSVCGDPDFIIPDPPQDDPQKEEIKFNIYPNPTYSWFVFDGDGELELEVYDMAGRKMIHDTGFFLRFYLPPGMYIAKVGDQQRKLIVHD